MIKRVLLIVFIFLIVVISHSLSDDRNPAQAQSSGTTVRVTVASDGTEANGESKWPSISGDGRYVTFESSATNLTNDNTNSSGGILLHDRDSDEDGIFDEPGQISTIQLGGGWSPSISDDGCQVAFYRSTGVFVYDCQTGDISRVSVATNGTLGNDGSFWPRISANGRHVAFVSEASNLVENDTNGWSDVFVHDRQTGHTTRVSIASDGTEGNNASAPYNPRSLSISGDGRFVAFDSLASNLVDNDTNNVKDVFIHDRDSDEDGIFDEPGQISTIRIPLAGGWSPSISDDGRFVSFRLIYIYVYDQQTGEVENISLSPDGNLANGASYYSSISSDGQFVAFTSDASNLIENDTNEFTDVFVHDRQTGETFLVSVASDGTQANNGSIGSILGPSISADGLNVSFSSDANNLVSADTNNEIDIFVHEQFWGGNTYSISGQVTDVDNNSISDVKISIGSNIEVFTDAEGNYIIPDLIANTYTITPTKTGFIFSPESQTVTLPPLAINQDFTAIPIDTDGDGLFDIWEINDTDLNEDGVVDIGPSVGADPNKRDIYVEVDWMNTTDHSHRPNDLSIKWIVDAFDEQDINLHVDAGPNSTDYVTGKLWGEYSKGNSIQHDDVLGSNTNRNALEDEWQALIDTNFKHSDQVFRYAIFAHHISHPELEICTSGIAHSQYFIVSLGGWPNCPLSTKSNGTPREQAGTFMHELGHTLGLEHGGNEREDFFNYKPNYLSVMNYSFQMSGLIIDGSDGHFDYSKFDLPDLNEARLSESAGLNDTRVGNYGTKYNVSFPYFCIISDPEFHDDRNLFVISEDKPINWDCDHHIDPGFVQVDINGGAGDAQLLTSFNDWENLIFRVGNIGQWGVAARTPLSVEDIENSPVELTQEQDLQIQRISEPRIQLSKTVTPETISPGEVVTYEITMLNTDASDAEEVTITDTLPSGFSYLAGSTTGATINDPFIDGQSLTWGPFNVPADGGNLTLIFQTTATTFPGTYLNKVSGNSVNGYVIPTGDTASVLVLVPIDIWPLLDKNTISPSKDHPIPIAILSTDTFMATSEVDTTTLPFGQTGNEESLDRCLDYFVDVNKDGLLDMICVFRSGLAGFEVGDTEGILKGATVDSVPIEGHDTIVTIPQSVRIFDAGLSGGDEVPPVETTAYGDARFRLNEDETELDYLIRLYKIKNVTAVHIHCGPEDTKGPVGVTLYDGNPVRWRVFAGTITAPDDGNACGWTDLNAVIAALLSGDTYVNIHTLAYPSGEVRGQIIGRGQ